MRSSIWTGVKIDVVVAQKIFEFEWKQPLSKVNLYQLKLKINCMGIALFIYWQCMTNIFIFNI